MRVILFRGVVLFSFLLPGLQLLRWLCCCFCCCVVIVYVVVVVDFSVCSTEYEEVRDLYLRAVQSASHQDEVDADVQVGHLWPCQRQLDSKSSATMYSP